MTGDIVIVDGVAVDLAVLRGLQQQLGPEGLVEIVTTFLGGLPDRIHDLTAACDSADVTAVASLAHACGSACLVVGLPEVGAQARALEATPDIAAGRRLAQALGSVRNALLHAAGQL